jgi:hypothetical protein
MKVAGPIFDRIPIYQLDAPPVLAGAFGVELDGRLPVAGNPGRNQVIGKIHFMGPSSAATATFPKSALLVLGSP